MNMKARPTFDSVLAELMADSSVPARERIADWLKKKGLTQVAAAELIKISRPTLSSALHGSTALGAPSIRKISKATGIPAGDLL